MTPLSRACQVVLFALLLSVSATPWAHRSRENARLPVAGQAPDFSLVDQNGGPFTLAGLRGKVVVVNFIYTTCNQACPLLTAKMASLQERLGSDFDSSVHFVSISVDPKIDTPEVLRAYAKTHRANLAGWSFLTGTQPMIEEVERAYGVLKKRANRGGRTEHLFVTSLIDRQGSLRVQYLGEGFKPEELLQDLQALLRE